MKRQGRRPVLITDAEPSQDDQLRMREIRYLIMMSIRALLLIVAAVLVGLRVPLLPLWLVLCVVGMVLLPWLAVILANDRPPKEQHRLSHRLHHRARVEEPPQNAIGAPREPTVIDADELRREESHPER
ncbi:DUF3099 domain-containing protein [Planosporangium thailandense]|uniref:DUF3099 domain-containing protein n=1 Tax=Planosporangium thailandense TaxID=765197 RepID=A0ABX0XSV7_9ACTN|nr:DUF3099 domain-containing protein [Planosporangium thailandense]